MLQWTKGLDHIGYQVFDITRSLHFYNSLGFTTREYFSKQGTDGKIDVAFIELGEVLLELYQLPKADTFDIPRCGINHIALEVTDLAKVQTHLQTLHYPINEGPIHEERQSRHIEYLLIRGPDGERVEFIEFQKISE